MHPIYTQPRRLGLYLFVFLQAGLLLGELLVRTAGGSRRQAMMLAAPLLLIHSFSCLASWYVCRGQPLGGARPERLVVAHLVAGLLASGVVTALGAGWARVLDGSSRFEGTLRLYRDSVTLIFVFALLTFTLTVAVHYLFIVSEATRVAESRAYELKLLAREAEIRALKAQIDPHFLFNSLNSISGLVVAEPGQARKMCVALADFLRQSLRVGDLEHLPLADELRLAESYLAVEQVRFGDRLRVELTRSDACDGCEVPPLILQPLVENAVRHGVGQLVEGGTVKIGADTLGGKLRLIVENPCDPDRPNRAAAQKPGSLLPGIGLTNVRRRLAVEFGKEGNLAIYEERDRFRVTLTLPRHRAVPPRGSDYRVTEGRAEAPTDGPSVPGRLGTYGAMGARTT